MANNNQGLCGKDHNCFRVKLKLNTVDHSRLSLGAGDQGFPPAATMNVAPCYFHRKIEEKKNQKKSLAVWFPTYFFFLLWNLSDNPDTTVPEIFHPALESESAGDNYYRRSRRFWPFAQVLCDKRLKQAWSDYEWRRSKQIDQICVLCIPSILKGRPTEAGSMYVLTIIMYM